MNSTKDKDSKSNNKKSSNKSQKYNSKKTKFNTPLVEPPVTSKPTRSNSIKVSSSKNKTALTPNNNNNNNNGKTKDLPSTTTTPSKSVHPTTPISDPPKFERSNSFSLTRSLSKLITSITGSKENISKVDDESSPYKFTRSRSMILLRRTNRRSVIEPQLEQLSEETEKPPDQTDSKNRSPEVVPEVEFEFKKPVEPSTPIFNPQENFQKRRSSSFISSFRKTLAGSAEKKKAMNPKWSASLQSLQAIDNMVSYENMKFIDYDKFHNYEKNLERQLSAAHLETAAAASIVGVDVPPTPTPTTPTLPVVVRRPKRGSPGSNIRFDREQSTQSAIFDSDFEHNLDKPKNLYRFSLDSRKLERLNDFSRGSMYFDLKMDALNLEDGSVGRRKRPVSFYIGSAATLRKSRSTSDVVDAGAAIQLKSKSLTHLDGLDSMIACPHGSAVGHGQQQKSRVSEQLESALPQPQTPSKPAVAAAYSHPPIGAVAALHHQHQHHAHQTPISPSSQHHHYPSSSSSASASGTQVYHHPSIASSTTSTTCNKMCCLGGGGGGATTITSSSALSPVASGVTGAIGCISPGSNIAISSSGVLTNSSAVMTSQGAGAGSATVAATAVAGAPPTTTVHKKKSSFMQRKKPLLTRSEISSSEFFSVSFCLENGCQEEEFIPAIKGVTLSEALNSSLRRRNLSFSQIIITDNNLPSFLESGSPPYTSSFEENTDVENLVGRHLVITERDGKKTLQKAASFGSRTRPPRLLSSASTEETTESEQRSIPGKQLKQRWSGLFGIKNPHQSQLCELLNSYAKNGVPQKTASLSFDHQDFDAAQDYLDNMHSSWKDFVHCDNMSDVQIKIQTAIWELVTTEVYYIHALQTVTDLFLACLEAIQEDKLLTDVDQHKLFSNVRDICEANLKFWTLYLYPMVANSINTHAPLCIDYFRQGFVTFATIFAPYKKYCAEQSTCQFYCKELNRNNALFTAYLAWCESQKMCNRLRLADILVRPMQRLTKYNLLLTAIRRHVLDEDDADAIDEMIHSVENFVCSVNNHLTTRQENERLKGVMARIESYDVVDTNNEHLEKLIKQHSVMFDLCAPMKGCPAHQVRHLFMEGDHKYKDNLGKADVHCFLLTDILLVCKTIAKKGLGALKVIRQPYLTDRLVVQHNNNTLNCVYLNEFQVATSAFTLQCSEAKNWYESMKRAKHIYARLKQGSANNLDSFRYGGSGASGGTADSLGVKKSPINSSICSHVSSANNSHSGSVEWNDSRNISVEFEKTNSLSSDEGTNQGFGAKTKLLATSPHKQKIITSSNTLSVQPINHLGQSLPNLNLHHSQSNLYHTYSNNTLLVPGPTSSHSGNLLSPSHRGISYPPPSPTRATLRRGMAFSASIKNPPLVKSRNITSQNSINWHQIPATPTPTSPQSQSQSQLNQTSSSSTSAIAAPPSTPLTDQTPLTPTSGSAAQLTNHTGSDVSSLHISSTETDV
ncbi:pleckstrin homology domain-containing family G member 5 isoform X3 [Eupeodes corollae]|uniref:pleckstrin homology domain-containing family G member 5 isoform X3 n=1 Tax=Eupeodes corollae TaxID=290404 RepID=UPI00248F4A2F|nr:pleckstrin homology domain-containing family G member 5 isoform X3 [Eupeodes corollae]